METRARATATLVILTGDAAGEVIAIPDGFSTMGREGDIQLPVGE